MKISRAILICLLLTITLLTTGCFYDQIVWSPDGKTLLLFCMDERPVYSEGEFTEYAKLVELHPDTGHAHTFFSLPQKAAIVRPNWSPDKSHISFYLAILDQDKDNKSFEDTPEPFNNLPEGTHLCVYNIKKDEVKVLTKADTQSDYQGPMCWNTWSPDSSKILFVGPDKSSNAKYRIALYEIETGNISLLTPKSEKAILPAWLPDGENIIYLNLNQKKRRYDLCKLNLKERGRQVLVADVPINTRIKNEEYFLLRPAVSPAGDSIAFINNTDIYLYDFMRGTSRVITLMPGYSFLPSWCPDNSRLAFNHTMSLNRDYGKGKIDIWITDSWGQEQKKLTDMPGEAYLPAWSPDSSRIAFFHATREMAFIPATVNPEGEVKHHPVNEMHHMMLGKYYDSLADEAMKTVKSWQNKAINSLLRATEQNPPMSAARDAHNTLDDIENKPY